MSEIDNHYLIFDRPHIYKCTCGYEVLMNVLDSRYFEKVYSKPENIKYLPCGHAVCAKKTINGKEQCVICLNKS